MEPVLYQICLINLYSLERVPGQVPSFAETGVPGHVPAHQVILAMVVRGGRAKVTYQNKVAVSSEMLPTQGTAQVGGCKVSG